MTPAFLHLAVLATLAVLPTVSVRPLEGDAVKGQLSALSNTSVQFETSDGAKELPLAQVMWLDFPAPPASDKPSVWIELLDGSRLQASAYAAADGKSQIALTSGQQVELPTRSIHTVRFLAQTPELAVQWRQIASSMASGDTLVIRKTSMRTVEQGDNEPRTLTEHALDQVEGAVLEVTPQVVVFELDGEKVDVRRDKLEGIVYYQPARRSLPAPLCRLTDAAGSQWMLKGVRLAEDALAVTTVGGLEFSLRLPDVARLDFSIGNIAFLSDLEAEPSGPESPRSLQPGGMSYKFSRIFQVRSGPPLGASAFRIGGQRYDNGLALHSPAKLVFRIPAGFRKFYAVAGIDDTILAPGRFALVILADGKEVARHEFSEQDRKPLPVTLSVEGARRLTIQLEPGEGQDIGDQLNLCEARFTR